MELIRLVIVALLVLIVFNLGAALFHLSSGRDGNSAEASAKLARALTWRVGLSITLFLLILFAWWQGWIHPHGIGG